MAAVYLLWRNLSVGVNGIMGDWIYGVLIQFGWFEAFKYCNPVTRLTGMSGLKLHNVYNQQVLVHSGQLTGTASTSLDRVIRRLSLCINTNMKQLR